MLNRSFAAVLAAAAITAVCHSEDSTRQPVPPADKRKEAETAIRDIFKDDLKKTAVQDQLDLAAKFIEQGKATTADPASRYELYSMAMDIAAKQGSVNIVCNAGDVMDEQFQVDAIQLKSKALEQIQRLQRTKEQSAELASTWLTLANDAVKKEDYAAALNICTNAQQNARGAQDMALFASVNKRTEEIRSERVQFDATKAARAKLFENPDDAASNLLLGKFYCFNKNDWAKGLPLLAKSGDAKWTEVAAADIAAPKDPNDQAALGDKWWALATTNLLKAEQDGVKVRAAHWYEIAVPELTGLPKLKLEKRLQELQPVLAAGEAAATGTSEETRKALPTDAEMKSLKELAIAEKNGDKAKMNDFFTLRNNITNRLHANPEKWSDDDLKARLDGEIKLDKSLNEVTQYKCSVWIWDSWVTFVTQSKTPESFARRVKALPDLIKQTANVGFYSNSLQDDKTRHAVHAYLTKNSSTYPSVAAKKQFCDWLKTNGINSPALEDYKKDLDAGTASAVKDRRNRGGTSSGGGGSDQ
jgi:hypothetical protein